MSRKSPLPPPPAPYIAALSANALLSPDPARPVAWRLTCLTVACLALGACVTPPSRSGASTADAAGSPAATDADTHAHDHADASGPTPLTGSLSGDDVAGAGHDDEPPPSETGTSIIVSGRPVHVGVPVVTWQDPGGFDGHRETCFFSDAELPRSPATGCDTPRRYAERDLDPAKVDLVVLHYDVAWTSRNCFKVLHDLRGLSCHFLLDVDGTIYQTLDLALRARHAGGVNDRSVGVEIAHPGPLELTRNLSDRYTHETDAAGDPDGLVRFDLGPLAPGVRTPDFVVRPARPAPISGPIHGRTYTMYDYTQEQYRALGHLLAALARAFPDLRLDAPRGPDGAVATTTVDPSRLGPSAGAGVVGHFHVGGHKQDPGPAFDWERVLTAARALHDAPPTSPGRDD